MENVIQPILSIVVVVNIILSLIIFSRSIHNSANVIFGLIAIVSSLWSIAIIGFYSKSEIFHTDWILITHFSAILIAFLFFIFSLYFPQKITINRKIVILCLLTFFIMSHLIFWTDMIVGGVYEYSYEINHIYPIYALVVMSYFLSGFFFLYKQFKYAKDLVQREQIKYVFVGSFAASTLAIIPDLIFPYFEIFDYTWLGPIFTLMMVVSLFVAMLRYNLFNIKVIFTEIVSILIVIALLVEIFFVRSTTELIFKVIVLVILSIFSYLLVKSVYREVSQREHIEKLATDLQKANDRLRELDKQKSEFVSFATHQLRAPLTAMKGYASLILEGDLGDLSKDIRSAITRIYDSSNTLTNIVDDYLNISRIELGTMKYVFENVDLKELVENAIGELKPNIEKSKLTFSFTADNDKKFIVNIDKDKFKQIIVNLIDNSMKYTPKGSVSVSLAKRMDDGSGKILFSIKDTGIGIAREVMPKLFAKFSRAENGTRQNIHGTGLGLFVAKQIVDAHKGKLWAESEGEGKGSAFFVELEEA